MCQVTCWRSFTGSQSGSVWNTGSPPWCGDVNWASLRLTESTFVDLYRVLEVVALCAHRRGVALSPVRPYRYHAKPRLFCCGPTVWNSLPPALRLLPRTLSDTFYNHLKTVLFDRAGVGSTSE